ncbi:MULTISPECIES: MazG-like family protein [Photorhabdus]|uniref:MazG-like family protein n=1 Tax=Photorhabdus bodei TaxID=2029681 RepID=A0AAW6BKK2_9GAMM|nr:MULTISPECIES: MazG-like family protein [Photorhabdus]MDB6372290.1 MazG-like family protein [Photorhabdus bodei]
MTDSTTTARTRAVNSVLSEMTKQDERWGADRDHHPFVWASILGEEVGEFHQAILHDVFGGNHSGTARDEAVQIAAVALQVIEYYDRRRPGLSYLNNTAWVGFDPGHECTP